MNICSLFLGNSMFLLEFYDESASFVLELDSLKSFFFMRDIPYKGNAIS